MLYENIEKLIQYGLKTGLIKEEDVSYSTNLLLDLFGQDDFEKPEVDTENLNLEEILKNLMDYAYENGILKENSVVYRDLFDTRIMNCLMPRPSEVVKTFHELYEKSPKDATDYFYKLSQDSNYIRLSLIHI